MSAEQAEDFLVRLDEAMLYDMVCMMTMLHSALGETCV